MNATARFMLRKVVRKVDRWAHFHRFEWNRVCALDDWMSGVPWSMIRSSRRSGEPTHARVRSYNSHPSRQVADHG